MGNTPSDQGTGEPDAKKAKTNSNNNGSDNNSSGNSKSFGTLSTVHEQEKTLSEIWKNHGGKTFSE